jgi:putative transposase
MAERWRSPSPASPALARGSAPPAKAGSVLKVQILAVELANRESGSSWREFLLKLMARGLAGVEFVVSDDHPGLKRAIREVLPQAAWQRCSVHFLRNALDYVPRKVDDDCLQELRWIYDRRELVEVQREIATWLAKWQPKYPKLCDWVEENIEETLTYYRLPRQHHKHMKSTNMLERLNQELKRRTMWCGSFPTPRVVCGWCGRSRSRRTRTGWKRPVISTWSTCGSTKRKHCGRWPPDGLWIMLRVPHKPHHRNHDRFAELDAHNSRFEYNSTPRLIGQLFRTWRSVGG